MSQLPGMPPGLPQPGAVPQVQAPQPAPQPVTKGSLVIFHYMLWKNDPTPVVIVSNYEPGTVLKGINLHYLSFPYVKRVLGLGGGNPSFSYYNIKADRYISGAFRSYNWRGIDFSGMRVIDAKFLLRMMNLSSSFDPLQLRAMRQQVEQQLAQQVNQPQAVPTAPQPIGPQPIGPPPNQV